MTISILAGVIGIGFWKGAVGATDPAAIVRAIRHVTDLVGINHVALGSDFDGATRAPFDASGLAHVTEALVNDLHAAGRKVWSWTANAQADIERLIALGVDGIFSDFPDRVRMIAARVAGSANPRA